MKFYIDERDANVYYLDGGWLRSTHLNGDGTFNTTESVDCYIINESNEC